MRTTFCLFICLYVYDVWEKENIKYAKNMSVNNR